MSTLINPGTPPAIRSPCMGLCRLDARGYCEGCQRSGPEIGQWSSMLPAQRDYVMDVLLPCRRDPT